MFVNQNTELQFLTPTNLNKENTPTMNTAAKLSKLAVTTCVIPMLAVFISTKSFAGLATPVAVSTITAPANTTTLVGVPYARPVEAFGTIASVNNTGPNAILTVAVDTAGGSPAMPASSALGNTNKNEDFFYVCEILDGDAIGLILDVVEGTATTLTVKGTIPTSAGISAASLRSTTKWALRKAHTLSSLCGAASVTNPFGSGSSAKASTVLGQVQILDTATGAVTTYYINKTGTGYNWRTGTGSDNFNHAPIGLGKGFLVVNLRSAPLTFTVSGDYRTARSRFIAQGGKKYLLANPGIKDADFATSTIVEQSPTRGTAAPRSGDDKYGIWDVASKAFAYFQIGGTADSSGASAYNGSGGRVNPTIGKFTSVLALPGGSDNVILTIAPAP
jgi:hypothetical protein